MDTKKHLKALIKDMGIASIQLILKNYLMNKIFNTKFKDLKIIKIESFKDKRGELFLGFYLIN